MNRNLTRLAVFLIAALLAGQAAAWRSANRFGGSTEHAFGEGTEHTNAWGGSTEHAFGGGTEHTNVFGGSTEGRAGDGVEHTNVYGGTTEAKYGDGAVHTGPYGATYATPVAVPYYSAGGCYGCAAAAGAVVGAAAGAAAASTSATNVTVVTGAPATYVMGTNYATLPGGCTQNSVGGSTYYLCGTTWFQPSYGANGVYYRVVGSPW